MSRNLSTAEVSRILGMKELQVRELVRSGLCRPVRDGRSYSFSFQDLVVLRAAQGLFQANVPRVRVQRALAALADDLALEQPLSGLRIFADGRNVAVRSEDAAWQPETGQTLFNFDVDELADRVEDLRSAAAARSSESRRALAEREFCRALDLEDDDHEGAANAYARALELDPELVDAYVNLGRLAHVSGDPGSAIQLYQAALEHSEDDPVVHFNLGLALEDAQGASQAIVHYERAVALDPDFADAHFNLAGLCELLGRSNDALRHYHAYKKLTEG
ncbi:MAG: tetratricopeptide repeat protein [bacterium]|nr:tetratricopeptide repeat protein [bacterium]